MEQNDIKTTFRENFDILREGRSNTEFAEFLGLSRQTVGFWLNGDRMPDACSLAKIAKTCGVSVDYLLGLTKVSSPDASVRAAAELTGLSVRAIHALMEYTASEENGNGISGFDNTSPCRPQHFIDTLITSPYLFRSTLDFCSAFNNYINSSAPNITQKKYGVADHDGDVIISAREFALLSVERSKSIFSGFISDLWDKLCDDYSVFPYESYAYPDYIVEEDAHGEA